MLTFLDCALIHTPLFPVRSGNNFTWVCIFSHSQMKIITTSFSWELWIYSCLLTSFFNTILSLTLTIYLCMYYLYIFVCVCAYAFKCVGIHMPQYACDGQSTAFKRQFCHSTKWVQGSNSLRSSGLVVGVPRNHFTGSRTILLVMCHL